MIDPFCKLGTHWLILTESNWFENILFKVDYFLQINISALKAEKASTSKISTGLLAWLEKQDNIVHMAASKYTVHMTASECTVHAAASVRIWENWSSGKISLGLLGLSSSW